MTWIAKLLGSKKTPVIPQPALIASIYDKYDPSVVRYETRTAVAYDALDKKSRERVLLWVLKRSLTPLSRDAVQFVQRIVRIAELQIVAPPMREYGVDQNGRAFQVTDFVAPYFLYSAINSAGSFGRYFFDIAGILAELHRAGQVVGDLCDHSFLLNSEGQLLFAGQFGPFDTGQPGGADAPEEVLGYLAPEQRSNNAVSQAGDIYAFGVLAFRMLTRKSFMRADTLQVHQDYLRTFVLPTVTEHQHSPRWLRKVIPRCVAWSAGERFANAEELLQALAQAGISRESGGVGKRSRDFSGVEDFCEAVVGSVRSVWLELAWIAVAALVVIAVASVSYSSYQFRVQEQQRAGITAAIQALGGAEPAAAPGGLGALRSQWAQAALKEDEREAALRQIFGAETETTEVDSADVMKRWKNAWNDANNLPGSTKLDGSKKQGPVGAVSSTAKQEGWPAALPLVRAAGTDKSGLMNAPDRRIVAEFTDQELAWLLVHSTQRDRESLTQIVREMRLRKRMTPWASKFAEAFLSPASAQAAPSLQDALIDGINGKITSGAVLLFARWNSAKAESVLLAAAAAGTPIAVEAAFLQLSCRELAEGPVRKIIDVVKTVPRAARVRYAQAAAQVLLARDSDRENLSEAAALINRLIPFFSIAFRFNWLDQLEVAPCPWCPVP